MNDTLKEPAVAPNPELQTAQDTIAMMFDVALAEIGVRASGVTIRASRCKIQN